MHWLLHLLGTDNGSGAFYLFGSGLGGELLLMTTGAILGWLARRFVERVSNRHLAQAVVHHRERLHQADTQHKEVTAQAERHHQQRYDQAQAHHEALKAHLTRAADGPVRAGAGTNPARSEGLPAETAAPAPLAAGSVVPPAAATRRKATATASKGM